MQEHSNENQSNQEKHHEYKKMNPKVFNPFLHHHRKLKASSQSKVDHSQSNLGENKYIQAEEQLIMDSQKNNHKVEARSSHSKKNPIAPIKQSFKILDNFGKIMKQEYSSIASYNKKLSQNMNRQNREPEIKLNQCLTLKVVKKLDNGGCIKKVLNVPTFKIYLLEQRPITSNDSKQNTQKDLEKWNSCPTNSYQLKNVKLYWNTPQQFVSLLHQYVTHSTLQSILSTSSNLPEQALAQKMVQIVHMISLFEKQGIKFSKLSSQQILVSNSGGIKVRPSINLGIQQSRLENSMNYQIVKWIQPQNQKMRLPIRIGLLVFYLSLGNFIMRQQVSQVIFELYDGERVKNQNKIGCCLLHRLDDFEQQLTLFTLQKKRWSRNLEDFVCRCLSFDRKRRIDLQQIKKHAFITRVEQIQKVSFNDILQIVLKQKQHSNTTEVQISYRLQLNKITDAIRMILINNQIKHKVQIPIKADNTTLQFIEEDIRVDKGIIMEKLNSVYADFK